MANTKTKKLLIDNHQWSGLLDIIDDFDIISLPDIETLESLRTYAYIRTGFSVSVDRNKLTIKLTRKK